MKRYSLSSFRDFILKLPPTRRRLLIPAAWKLGYPEDQGDAIVEGVVEGLILARVVKVQSFCLDTSFPED